MVKRDVGLLQETMAVRKLLMEELCALYLKLFGEEGKRRNRDYLSKRIAYRLQERKHGGLTASEKPSLSAGTSQRR